MTGKQNIFLELCGTVLFFAVVLTVAGLIFKQPLLMLLGASEVTLPYAEQYITIYLLGTIFVMFGLGLNNLSMHRALQKLACVQP